MKKLTAIILALALMLCLSVPAFANTYDEGASGGDTTLNYKYKPAPVYTVTIPGTLSLNDGDNQLELKVSDSKYLIDNEKIVVITAAGTQETDNALVLVCDTAASGKETIPYGLFDSKGTLVGIGATLATFGGNGIENIKIQINGAGADIEAFKPYTGTLTFGIALATPAP